MLSSILAAVSQREFWTGKRIKDLIARTSEEIGGLPDVCAPREAAAPGVDALRAMLMFSTSRQRTWLVSDRGSVHCVLDDIRREEPRVQWSAKTADLQPIRADTEFSSESGALHFGHHGNEWLYSKDLFLDRDIVPAIQEFVNDIAHNKGDDERRHAGPSGH